MPKYAKFMKDLLTQKGRGNEASKITLNERYSVVVLNKIPLKEKDPGSFTIPCVIGQSGINKALADLGASIGLMPYSMFLRLNLGELKPTRLEWADKVDDALWAFRTAYKAPIRCTPFRIVYGKACHLPLEIEHKAYWALKKINLDLEAAGKHRKLRTRWYRPYTVSKVYPYGTVEVCGKNGVRFKVNGHRYVLWKPSRDFTRPLGPPSGLKGLLHMLNATVIPMKVRENELAQDGDFLDFSTGLLHFICSEAKLKGVSCSNSTLPVYFISLMYNRDIVQNKWGMGVELSLDLFLHSIFYFSLKIV
ncbi:reverse transcriptase domain-containing protein [Tanacetum coccineum]|uniref:Reverse transcriptase domain-containing protein n=1 Tax=Tanacetum coccineum TaxID=301880 RepID=A0ABQ4WI85_9ASTR